jgi:hypothetical protein
MPIFASTRLPQLIGASASEAEEKRHAGEWPGGWRSRSGPRGFEGLEDNGVDLRVARLYARDRLFYQIARSDFAFAYQFSQTQTIVAIEISERVHVFPFLNADSPGQ